MRENLTLHPSIQERVGQFQAARFQQPVIGVHVRYMDRKAGLAELRRKVDQPRARPEGTLLRQGGLLIVTADNPDNPLYPPLQWAARRFTACFVAVCAPKPAAADRFRIPITADACLVTGCSGPSSSAR